MTFTFITTPRSIRNVSIYYRSSDESMHTLHVEKLKGKVNIEGTTNAAKEMRNTRIKIYPYLTDIGDYIIYSHINGKFYVASMFSQMIPCYTKLRNNYRIEIKEIFDDVRCTYTSDISIDSMVYHGKEEIEKAITRAARSAEVTIGSEYLKMEVSNIGVTFTVDPTVETFARDKSVAESIGTYLMKVADILQDKSGLVRRIVLCCDKCFKEIARLTIDNTMSLEVYGKKCCEDGTIVDIDTEIYDTIKHLNEVGYHTKYCCGSHEWDGDMYINFKHTDRSIIRYISENHPIEGFNIELENGPICIRIDREYYLKLETELGFEKARETMIKRLGDGLVECMEEYKNAELNTVQK